MAGFFLLATLMAYAAALYFSRFIVTDIQLVLVCLLALGGTIFLGITAVLAALDDIATRQKTPDDTAK